MGRAGEGAEVDRVRCAFLATVCGMAARGRGVWVIPAPRRRSCSFAFTPAGLLLFVPPETTPGALFALLLSLPEPLPASLPPGP